MKNMAEKYKLEFTIPRLPLTPNKLLGAHWRSKYGHSKTWTRLVWKATWPFKPPQPLAHAALTLIRYSAYPLDPDNLPGSFKSVIDALVKNEILADDNSSVVQRLDCRQVKTKRLEARIKVIVEEL